MNNQNGQLTIHEQFNQAAQAGRMDKQIVDAVLAHQSDPTPDTKRAIKALIARLENNAPVQASVWQPTVDELSALPPNEIARKLKKVLIHPQPVPLATLGPPKQRQWLIPNWLPRGRVGMLTGEGGRGKSFLALQLAEAITTEGGCWLTPSHITKPRMPAVEGSGTVLYATWEDEPTEFVRRIGPEKAAAMDKCHVLDLAGTGPIWGVPEGGSTRYRAALLTTGEELRASAESLKADLLIIDSLAGAYGANENDRSAVREFMASFDSWGRQVDCAVMLIAHPPKKTNSYSGSTDWHSASRWRWELATNDEGEYLKCEKTSYAKKPDEIRLVRNEDTGWLWAEADTQITPHNNGNGTGKSQLDNKGKVDRTKQQEELLKRMNLGAK
ncbi:MAG: AAA family ATPase [Caldilineaceae bacterium]|nr:AAA family ATPase [Caldilineaceae bacterium]MDE0196674.1 AAA family ATPase [Caldilineaceae bacterium]